jgi:Fur family transcriptional regulator, ferric uptake regulator
VAEVSTDSWALHARDVLARAGLRRGGARAAVIELLDGQACALTAQEIEDELRSSDRRIGRASVYRALEVLVDHGLLARLEVGQGMARYEPVSPGGEHHHHLVCERCGKLVAFNDPALERAIESLAERLGLEVADHEVLLRGACKRCEAPRV